MYLFLSKLPTLIVTLAGAGMIYEFFHPSPKPNNKIGAFLHRTRWLNVIFGSLMVLGGLSSLFGH